MKTLKIFSIALILSFIVIGLIMPQVKAAAVLESCDTGDLSQTNICQTINSKSSTSTPTTLIDSIISIFSYIAGITSIILVIFSGLLFVTSAGDPKRVHQARDTILYAGIGIAVVVIARLIILFVVNKVG